ncbi:LamB/YcsF family protein [Aeromicrobium sp. Root472D3]|uniref:LamB/YcsF family protein n=1 Tax=Aeromicrobium sp. Root472D3 TaxID=1736540 RepID=UPI00070040DF|nr:5-oxoprolinase subunit PxpA [Aeromicrobium sp. Root472D3]KQX74198.1 hypothetical protein ASD10_02810 [Aeromicrobium sp. Root472D3]
MTPRIDVNSDLAEGFGRWSFDTDDDLLTIVSSANVACGFHAGDPSTIRHALELAASNDVAVGAHVGYPDLQGFGRRRMDMDPRELTDAVMYQVSALSGLARVAGTRVRYVKPHGALYNTVVDSSTQARAVVEAIVELDPGLAVMGLPGSELLRFAGDAGLATISEAFADRAYLSDGSLVPRSVKGAVLHDVDAVVERVVRMVTDGVVETLDGSVLELSPDSYCIHGDSPGAVTMGRRMTAALRDRGYEISHLFAATP